MIIEVAYALRLDIDGEKDVYVEDLCGHTYKICRRLILAKEWPTRAELVSELAAAEIDEDFEIVEIVRCRPG